jgi:beta-phosphoglucomutase
MFSSMFHSVIFDMDGVLVDSHPVHERAWRQLMQTLGRAVSDQELEFALDGRKRDDILRFFLGDLPPSELQRYGLQKDRFFVEYAAEMKLINGTYEFVTALREAGVRLAVGSSASRVRVERILQQFDLKHCFAAVVTGDDVVNGKPDPAVFQMACERLGGIPGTSLVVEDAVSGVKGARAAGMQCLGVARESRAHLLYEAGAHHVVPDFAGLELVTIFEAFDRAAEFRSPGDPITSLRLGTHHG